MRLSNGRVWIELAESYGPRIAGLGFEGEPSVFGCGERGERETPAGLWRSYGGHRMWLAPEQFPATYRIDDAPPVLERLGPRAASATHAGDALGFATELRVRIDDEDAVVETAHRAHHHGDAAQTVAPWGITVMRPGGTALLPRVPRRAHVDALQPDETLSLWAYARLDDPRVRFECDATFVRNDPTLAEPWKIGTSGVCGWCAYLTGDVAFVKRFVYDDAAVYPDRGCAVETFTAGDYFELETLAPLTSVRPGATIAYVERWSLHRLPPGADPLAQLAAELV